MIVPVRRAIDDDRFEIRIDSLRKAKGKRFPRGSLILSTINPDDVIEASRKLR